MSRILENTIRLLQQKDDIVFVAVNSLHGSMQQRIFQEGKDSNDRPLGPYRSRWKLTRAERGRQIDNKDLNFEGNLELGFSVGRSNNQSVIGFTTINYRLIADGQTGQVGRPIFKPTGEELKETYKIFNNQIRKILDA